PRVMPARARLRFSWLGLQLPDSRDGVDVAVHQLAVTLLAGDEADAVQLDLAPGRAGERVGALVHVREELEGLVERGLPLEAGGERRAQHLDPDPHRLIEVVAELQVLDAPRHRRVLSQRDVVDRSRMTMALGDRQ